MGLRSPRIGGGQVIAPTTNVRPRQKLQQTTMTRDFTFHFYRQSSQALDMCAVALLSKELACVCGMNVHVSFLANLW